MLYEDGERVPLEVLQSSSFKVRMENDSGIIIAEAEVLSSHDYHRASATTEFYNTLMRNAAQRQFLETGVLSFRFVVPQWTNQLKLRATFTNEETSAENEMILRTKYSSDEKYVTVWTSSEELRVDDYAIIHANANFIIDVFYVLVSRLL